MPKYSLKNMLAYAGYSPEEYESIRPRIRRKNLVHVRLSSFIGMLMFGALALASPFLRVVSSLTTLYAVSFAVMAAIYLLSRFLCPRVPSLVLPMCYLFLTLAFGFGMAVGSGREDMAATSFDVLLFALPLLIVDRPWRISLMIGAAAASFCVLVRLTKLPDIASLDCLNAVCFAMLSVVVNYTMLRSKFSDLINQTYVERERDTDDLTRLLTKAAARREAERYIRESTEPAALLMIDVDNFKGINDTLGHAYGDVVLRTMGECVRKTFRQSDVLARFGGDEFVLFLPKLSDRELICGRIDLLVNDLKTRLNAPESAVEVSGSIGVAFWPQDAATYDELIARADEALYDSKRKGKDCYSFYFDREQKQG